MDRFTKETRSRVMRNSRSRGNRSTELRLRGLLARSGLDGWEIGHAHGDLGRPDFLFVREKVAIFVDGCFWHGCTKCKKEPRTNVQFWRSKFKANRKRARNVEQLLYNEGWKHLRFWEHELKGANGSTNVIECTMDLIARRYVNFSTSNLE